MVLLCSQSNKVSVFRCLLTETNIKESTMEENSTERASTCGLTVHATKVNSIKEWDKAKVAGNQPKITEIFTSVVTMVTRKTGMVDMFGQTDACIKVDSLTIWSIFCDI